VVAGFFFYRDDLNEIDMEQISSFGSSNSQFNFNGVQIGDPNQVDNPQVWSQTAFDANQTSTIVEYRFDWESDRIVFFRNGVAIHCVCSSRYVPQVPGQIMINHWSGGSPGKHMY
jgi:beta-glucanase (GH16 family)